MDANFKQPIAPARKASVDESHKMEDNKSSSHRKVPPLLALSTATLPDSRPNMVSPKKKASLSKSANMRSDPGTLSGLRDSSSRRDLTKSNFGPSASPAKKKKPIPEGKTLYSPRWIISVKRETDKQVKAFLENLMSDDVKSEVSEDVLQQMTVLGNDFLRLKTERLGEATRKMVKELQHMKTKTARDKKLAVQLMLAISSCSRLDQYIASVREAESAVMAGEGGTSRHGYDGQVEYFKTDSPRLRESNRRANFLSQSLDAENFDSVVDTSNSQDMLSDAYNMSGGKLCRICEQMVELPIYDEHVKFCQTRAGYDIEVITADQQINNLSNTLAAESKLKKVLEKSLGITTTGVGGFYEFMGLKKELSKLQEAKELEENSDTVEKAKELLHRKMIALQGAEKTILQSPRLPSPKMGHALPGRKDSLRTSARIPSITDFEILKPITRGGYGGVYLARKKATKDLYCIKALNRKEMIRRGEMKSILAERNILVNIHSEYVVKMFFAMASKKYLFFVLEYMSGGDCFSLLRRFGRFDEGVAKFYIAEVVLALEDIHRQGVVHR